MLKSSLKRQRFKLCNEVNNTNTLLRMNSITEELADETAETCNLSIANDEDEEFETNEPVPGEQNAFLKQNRAVSRLKMVVIFMLFMAAVLISLLTYYFNHRAEQSNFEDEFDNNARKIADTFKHNMEMKFLAADTLAVLYTSRYGKDSPSTFPNVTMLDFEEQTKSLLKLAHARAMIYGPLIHEKSSWEAYAEENAHRVGRTNEDSQDMREVKQGMYKMDWNLEKEWEMREVDFIDEKPERAYYLPVWQIAPTKPNKKGIMFNQLSERARMVAIDNMINEKVATLTEILYHDICFHPHADHHNDPSAVMFHPVFDDFNKSNVVGAISTLFSWKHNLMNVLPENAGEIDVVLESSAGQEYSFSVTGSVAKFTGVGDLHQKEFDHMAVVGECGILEAAGDSATTGHHRHRQLNLFDPEELGTLKIQKNAVSEPDFVSESIRYTYRIYPTKRFQNIYITSKPAIYALIVALVFLFTSAVFISYDCLVERRQKMVAKSAKQSSDIVHSLFPSVVRDRLYKNSVQDMPSSKDEHTEKKTKSQSGNNARGRLRNFVQSSRYKSSEDDPEYGLAASEDTKPIADLFPDTTIMFADIAGFTKWCSSRQPSEVFTLLETLYKAYDAEARKRGVFKVETIGDCYVAVVGLPDPKKAHAGILSKFALRCVTLMDEISKDLEPLLGPGTADLKIRIGLHSGPVTAGVLRGEKARFQLFGDTMNTASRMESTGLPSRIHVSEDTAALLRLEGRGCWIEPREDTVFAKGKGEMKTYWMKKNPPKARYPIPECPSSTGDSERNFI